MEHKSIRFFSQKIKINQSNQILCGITFKLASFDQAAYCELSIIVK